MKIGKWRSLRKLNQFFRIFLIQVQVEGIESQEHLKSNNLLGHREAYS